jgi:U6 snRNA-associated Sm-like protein LSm6
MEPSRKPLNVLIKSVGSNVTINLKGHGEYWGKMTRVDGYMNIMLKGAKEYDQNGLVANYGDVFVRGNNIVYICIGPDAPPSIKGKTNKGEDDDEAQ